MTIFTDPKAKRSENVHFEPRVAKCHGYGGYIRVKKLEGWGKKFGRTFSFAKSSIVLGKFEQLILNSVFKPGLQDRMFSFCSPEVAFGINSASQ